MILFCDNHLLVAVKPAGISTQPHDNAPNFTDQMKAYIKQKFAKPGRVFLEPIHRLDKLVSGIVVFARTSKALSRLQEQMRERKIEKTYTAWVKDHNLPSDGKLVHHLLHDEHKARVHKSGKEAILLYHVIKREKNKALVEIQLLTGRYHQIRVQFAHIHCPIIGDTKYGSTASWPHPGIALHHSKLALFHPISQEKIEWQSPSFLHC